jgi:hypothetical protein
MLITILFVLAAICFLIAAIEVPVPRVSVLALGLFFFALAFVFQTVPIR